jgi:hypothetical protein
MGGCNAATGRVRANLFVVRSDHSVDHLGSNPVGGADERPALVVRRSHLRRDTKVRKLDLT